MNRLLGAAGVLGAVTVLTFAGAQPAGAFCGSLCHPEAAALAAALQTGSTTGVSLTGATAVAAQVGSAATVSGQIFGIAVTGGVATLAGGLSLLAGGLPDWIWSPDAAAIADMGDVGTGSAYTVVGTGTPFASWPSSVSIYPTSSSNISVATPWADIVWPSAYETGTHYIGGRSCFRTDDAVKTAADFFAEVMGGVQPSSGANFQAPPAGWACTGGYNQLKSTSGNMIVSIALRTYWDAGNSGFMQIQPKSNTGTGWYSNSTGILEITKDWAPEPSSITGYVQQTHTCNRPNGTTYTQTSMVPFTAAAQGAMIEIAGLMCELGDWSSDAEAQVVTGQGVYQVVGSPEYSPGWEAAPAPIKSEIVKPGPKDVFVPVPAPGDPVPSPIVNPTPEDPWSPLPTPIPEPVPNPELVPEPPGTDCSLGWDDLLDGSIVFEAVGCALAWAFVPSDAFWQTRVAAVGQVWADSQVGQFLFNSLSLPRMMVPVFQGTGSASCGKLIIPLDGVGPFQQDVTWLDPCADYMQTPVSLVRILLVFSLLLSAIPLVANPLLQSFGMARIGRPGRSEGE